MKQVQLDPQEVCPFPRERCKYQSDPVGMERARLCRRRWSGSRNAINCEGVYGGSREGAT